LAVVGELAEGALIHDEESGLVYNRERMLYPTLGRFMQRDPLEYVDGADSYQYQQSSPLIGGDSLGTVWIVSRQGQSTAACTGQCGDSVRTLATEIRLNAKEFRSWLTPTDGQPLPINENTALTSARSFTVPNVGYLECQDYGVGFMGQLGWWSLGYSRQVKSRWKAEGLQVIDQSGWLLNANKVIANLGSRNIYKFYFVGHGGKGTIYCWDTGIIAQSYTIYGIAEMDLVACQSNDYADDWALNVSKLGTLLTFKGDITARQHVSVIQPGRR
jgi:RHS repeat-associated protein